MENQYEKKITWTIKNVVSSLISDERIYSDTFVVGAAKWYLKAYPKEGKLALYLTAPDVNSLPSGWKRHIKVRFTVVNQNPQKLCRKVYEGCLSDNNSGYGSHGMLPISQLIDRNGGFLVNGGEVKIVAEVKVIEVIWKSDVLLEETLLVDETIDVHGFQVRPSQVEQVKKLFYEHPRVASNFRAKNQRLRTSYLDNLLCLNEILTHSPEELSVFDVKNAFSTFTCLQKSGFKLDWLEFKLKEIGRNRIHDVDDVLQEFMDFLQLD